MALPGAMDSIDLMPKMKATAKIDPILKTTQQIVWQEQQIWTYD
jgi:hypothetical protein